MKILIWEARTAKNISIPELSKKTEISTGALSNYENGIREPKPSQLEKIAKALNMKISDLFYSEYN